ncbi:hypothetical protein FVE85_6434 [Porphyridium purpureum]|uniref:Uncharacterized protein n=1 Tax=Porphyridium purpureum TaxID=35688 RepID=A0A5J4Z4D2_PORPP|nr:hypothetical protein FVE85_6434 [Porphyridium purpureum]|eukprot:POR5916..scf295_1
MDRDVIAAPAERRGRSRIVARSNIRKRSRSEARHEHAILMESQARIKYLERRGTLGSETAKRSASLPIINCTSEHDVKELTIFLQSVLKSSTSVSTSADEDNLLASSEWSDQETSFKALE